MAGTVKLGSTKRYGPRYGRRLKHKLAPIEAEQRKLHKCPSCGHVKAKRVSYGIWHCSKCQTKFTARAYTVPKKLTLA